MVYNIQKRVCDRCGTTIDGVARVIHVSIGGVLAIRNDSTEKYDLLDLCDSCADSFSEWLSTETSVKRCVEQKHGGCCVYE